MSINTTFCRTLSVISCIFCVSSLNIFVNFVWNTKFLFNASNMSLYFVLFFNKRTSTFSSDTILFFVSFLFLHIAKRATELNLYRNQNFNPTNFTIIRTISVYEKHTKRRETANTYVCFSTVILCFVEIS